MDFKAVVALYQDLSKEWGKGKDRDVSKVGKLLNQLKMSLTTLSFLPTGEEKQDVKQMTVSRDTLEIGAQYAVLVQDIPMFERYIAQLHTYYFDFSSHLPDSPYKCQLLGLNLLCLLSQNRVAEFHTELERLSGAELEDLYIRNPISLEQYIMEGSYTKVQMLRNNAPAESYKFFMDILMVTVRNEIASCMEKAYKDISCLDAAKMLDLPSGEVNKYAKERNWRTEANKFVFRSETAEKEDSGVPSLDLAKMAISYAREMEQIV